MYGLYIFNLTGQTNTILDVYGVLMVRGRMCMPRVVDLVPCLLAEAHGF